MNAQQNPTPAVDRALTMMIAVSMQPPEPVAPDVQTLRFLAAGRVADLQAHMSMRAHYAERGLPMPTGEPQS